MLSEHPLIFSIDNFLTSSECNAIKDAAIALRNENDYDGKQLVELPQWPVSGAVNAVPHAELIESVLCRIDKIMGVERHEDEVRPKVHEYRPRAPNECCDNSPLLSGLHVDINVRPFRYATAILYLSTTTDGSGATIFPCVNCDTAVINAASHLIDSNVYHTDHGLQDPSMRESSEILLDLKLDQPEHGPLCIRPDEGKLAIFFSCDDDGLCDPFSWHGAGTVQSKSTCSKWTFQCFKEIPPDSRLTSSSRARFVARLRERLKRSAF